MKKRAQAMNHKSLSIQNLASSAFPLSPFSDLVEREGLYESQTKLVRFGARDYDAEVGRWTCKDPIGFLGLDANLYDYCFCDPVNINDEIGMKEGCDEDGTKPCMADCISKLRTAKSRWLKVKGGTALVGLVGGGFKGAQYGATIIGALSVISTSFSGPCAAVAGALGVTGGAWVGGIIGGLIGGTVGWYGSGFALEWAFKSGAYASFIECLKGPNCPCKPSSDLIKAVFEQVWEGKM